MQEFVRDDEILETCRLVHEIGSERDRAGGRAGAPLARHLLHSDQARGHFEPLRPKLYFRFHTTEVTSPSHRG